MATTLTGAPVNADEVKKLQEKLINAGYGLSDTSTGTMDDNTKTALESYKAANADDTDLAKLYAGETAPEWLKNGAGDAEADIPAAGTLGAYDAQLQSLYDQIVNRDKFSYDVNEDVIYQQLKEQYTKQGELAMKDTMGQAAALTGGYGNSYAQGVGQQQYDKYLQALNENIPQLYGQARDEYDAEGNRIQNLYALTAAARGEEYDTQMQTAAQMAQYGDFSGFKELYGEDKGKLMEDTWFLQNPDLALKLGLIDQTRYNSIMGIVPGQGGGGGYNGWYEEAGQDVITLQEKLNTEGFPVKIDGLKGPETIRAYEQWKLAQSTEKTTEKTYEKATKAHP